MVEFNNTDHEYPQAKTIHRLFEEQAEKSPDRIAVVDSYVGSNVTYRRLNQQSGRLAGLLREKGVLADQYCRYHDGTFDRNDYGGNRDIKIRRSLFAHLIRDTRRNVSIIC